MARFGKAYDKKAYSDLNYVEHKTIHINLLFTRSQEPKYVEILGTEITYNDSVLIRIKYL